MIAYVSALTNGGCGFVFKVLADVLSKRLYASLVSLIVMNSQISLSLKDSFSLF